MAVAVAVAVVRSGPIAVPMAKGTVAMAVGVVDQKDLLGGLRRLLEHGQCALPRPRAALRQLEQILSETR